MSIPAMDKEWPVCLTVATKELKPIFATRDSNESGRRLVKNLVILQNLGYTSLERSGFASKVWDLCQYHLR